MATQATTLPRDLVPISEAATRAGIALNTVYRRIWRGEIAAYGADRSYRVSLSEVLPLKVRKAKRDHVRTVAQKAAQSKPV